MVGYIHAARAQSVFKFESKRCDTSKTFHTRYNANTRHEIIIAFRMSLRAFVATLAPHASAGEQSPAMWGIAHLHLAQVQVSSGRAPFSQSHIKRFCG